MVTDNILFSMLRTLEKYLIKKNNFRLGINYNLILLIPTDTFVSDSKFSIVLSSTILDNLSQKKIIQEILNQFVEENKVKEYNSISRINILHTSDNLVNSFRPIYSYLGPSNYVYNVEDINVAGIQFNLAYLVKSVLLEKLYEGHATTIRIMHENGQYGFVNAGIIRIERNFDLVSYTRKGLDIIFRPQNDEERNLSNFLKEQTEEYLIEHQYIYTVNIDQLDEF